jgi:O-acetyl-ADP-ribose deacetylase (regulator of RNase III)
MPSLRQSEESAEEVTITYTTGDAVHPAGDGQKIIAHICNDEGKWGSGFVVALSKRNRIAEGAYRMWHRNGFSGTVPFRLGEMQMVNFDDDIWVANMIAQRGIRSSPDAPRVVDYDALRSALTKVSNYSLRGWSGASYAIHMPRIGCGLGGGSWDEIEPIIQQTLVTRGHSVTVYDLEQE